MRVTILGTGAMACLFGARLAPVAKVALAGTWREALAAIGERGIILEHEGASSCAKVDAVHLSSEVMPADLVLVLVKAWQTERIARHIDALLRPAGVAVTLQNGLGNLEKLGPRARLGVTAVGATPLGPGRVRSAGDSSTHVVAPEWIVDLLTRAGFETYRAGQSEMKGLLWGKLMVNCGINALSALLRVPNGELLKRTDACRLMEAAAMECVEVAHSKGIALPFSDPLARVRQVAEKTASNRSSMYHDLVRGAPTECNVINGAVVREGRLAGLPTPVNEVLWRLVSAAASGNREGKIGDESNQL